MDPFEYVLKPCFKVNFQIFHLLLEVEHEELALFCEDFSAVELAVADGRHLVHRLEDAALRALVHRERPGVNEHFFGNFLKTNRYDIFST